MLYADIRPLIKTGDCLLFSHAEMSSWYDFQVQMVRMATRSDFSHVGIAYVAHDRIFVLEAVSNEVRCFPLSRATPFFWVPNPKKAKPEALEWAFKQLGLPYENKWKMVLAKVFPIKLKGNSRWQCSEYFNGFLRANGQWLTDVDEPAAIGRQAIRLWGPVTYVE